jgi:hypothetical protein
MLRLAIGSRSSLCPVVDGFRLIVIAEQDYAYRSLDLPLLNRFEKQVKLFLIFLRCFQASIFFF